MTLKADMVRALEEDDAMKDVTLIGSDGGRVSASKTVLAIRSPVFKRMFYGNFQEAESAEVPMDYTSGVLQVVVNYCYMDVFDLDVIMSADEDAVDMTDKEAVSMVQVRDAANYLELFDLHKSCSNELGDSIFNSNNPSLPLGSDSSHVGNQGDLACVCAILQELLSRGGKGSRLWSTCVDLVEADTEGCFLPQKPAHQNKGILACSLPLIVTLFQCAKLDAFVAVTALKKWHQEHGETLEKQESQEELQKVAEGIKLEAISSNDLAKIKPCTLFPIELLYKAFVNLGNTQNTTPALKNYHPTLVVRGAGVECVNGAYRWRGSGSNCYELVGKYGIAPSKFRVIKTERQGWQLVVQNAGRAVLYQSSVQSMNPPFALWDCIDGNEPTPYVSLIHQEAEMARNAGGFCFTVPETERTEANQTAGNTATFTFGRNPNPP